MTASIVNLELFFEKHPELAHRKEEIMAAALRNSENGIVESGVIDKILDDLSGLFFAEVHGDPKYTKLWFEEFQGKIVDSPIPGTPGGKIVIISQEKALEPGFGKAIQKFQYGKTKEESDEGFEQMKKSAQQSEEDE